jgi:hypothetical protein
VDEKADADTDADADADAGLVESSPFGVSECADDDEEEEEDEDEAVAVSASRAATFFLCFLPVRCDEKTVSFGNRWAPDHASSNERKPNQPNNRRMEEILSCRESRIGMERGIENLIITRKATR